MSGPTADVQWILMDQQQQQQQPHALASLACQWIGFVGYIGMTIDPKYNGAQ